MACRSGCPTQDHDSWGECARAANMRVAYSGVGGLDYSAQKKWDKELDFYKSARAQGVQPASTRTKDIRKALEISDRTGTAFNAG